MNLHTREYVLIKILPADIHIVDGFSHFWLAEGASGASPAPEEGIPWVQGLQNVAAVEERAPLPIGGKEGVELTLPESHQGVAGSPDVALLVQRELIAVLQRLIPILA